MGLYETGKTCQQGQPRFLSFLFAGQDTPEAIDHQWQEYHGTVFAHRVSHIHIGEPVQGQGVKGASHRRDPAVLQHSFQAAVGHQQGESAYRCRKELVYRLHTEAQRPQKGRQI